MKRLAITVIALVALAQPAFAGWYQMGPPAVRGKVFDQLPLYDWQRMQSFDTAAACNADLDALKAWADQASQADIVGLLGTPPSGYEAMSKASFVERVHSGLCVSDTDPRLQANR